MGRWMVDLGIGPWGEEPTYHAPCFVVTHRPAETIVKKGGTSYIFVTEGFEISMAQAHAAAGEQDVMVNGGADIDRQYLNAGLIDEIRLHLVPIILGGGTPLFTGVRPGLRLVPSQATNSPLATHLTYQVDHPASRLSRRGLAGAPGSRARWRRRRQQRESGTWWSNARTRRNGRWRPGCWTSCRSTKSQCCSVQAVGCSNLAADEPFFGVHALVLHAGVVGGVVPSDELGDDERAGEVGRIRESLFTEAKRTVPKLEHLVVKAVPCR
jgi:dihydrofolate reductase